MFSFSMDDCLHLLIFLVTVLPTDISFIVVVRTGGKSGVVQRRCMNQRAQPISCTLLISEMTWSNLNLCLELLYFNLVQHN